MSPSERAPAGGSAEPGGSAARRTADPPEVADAVRRLQQGDDAALEIVVHRFGRGVKQLFLNRRLPEAVVEDLCQETWLRAWRQIRQYRFDGNFAAWLQRIAERQWMNDHRARQTQKRSLPGLPLDVEPGAGEPAVDRPLFGEPPPSPEAAASRSERVRRMVRALGLLAPGQRRCLLLRFGHELKYREVAEVMGVSTGAVQSQVHEGKNRLRLLLGADRGGGEKPRG